jgi:hypothetical protein
MDGRLANAIEPWGPPLMAMATAVVRDTSNVPYVDTIQDAAVAEVVTEIWPREWVLAASPADLWHGH